VSEHDWLLLGPAWSWGEGDARATAPVLQKYDTSDPVKPFAADPRSSLPFTAEDVVYDLPTSKSDTFVRTNTRKLFLDAHKRFYLVACELHCDAAGLPSEGRGKSCEAGFVIRRRRVVYPDRARPEAIKLLKRIAETRAKLTRVEADCGCGPYVAVVPRATAPARAVALPVARATQELEQRQADLSVWFEGIGGIQVLEGWVADPDGEAVGSWQLAEESLQETAEAVFPLYPLVPDPRDEEHAARGRTIYFGLVPTGGAEHDPSGTPRFDDQTLYEVRCFVRRHRDHCERKQERNDCHGPLFWSRPTEPYRLAAHFDLHGTSNRPVTIQMPDVPALLAQAKELPLGPKLSDGTRGPAPRGCGRPVRWVSPKDSLPAFSLDLPTSSLPTSKGMTGQVAMLSAIPLHTIVGQIVFNIFKPIIVFLFGLQALLSLKVFVPSAPEVDMALLAGIQGEIRPGACLDFTEGGR
jgi:hypothetical protein